VVDLRKEESVLVLTVGNHELTLKDTPANQKSMIILSHEFKPVDRCRGEMTFQEISEALGHSDRQWSHNFYREYDAAGGDFGDYLKRRKRLEEAAFPLVEAQILSQPFLSMAEQYRLFCERHPEQAMCRTTFEDYVSQVDSCQLLKRVQQLVTKGEVSLDREFYLKELLNRVKMAPHQRKEIRELFPEVAESEARVAESKPIVPDDARTRLGLLAVLLYVSGMSMDMLALLLGRCKTTIHNMIYAVACEELERFILGSIHRWSGYVSFDEKWIKIDGVWHFALCAVDAVSGFPLLMRLYPELDAISWQLFMLEFKGLYGVPKLIISDGCQKLFLARSLVFAGVRYQFCKFHKLKNLFKKLRRAGLNDKQLRRAQRLADHIFSNGTISSRKHAAKRLQEIGGDGVAVYVKERFLDNWRHLTGSLTNNVAERWNRKLEKALSGRYGIKNRDCALVIMRGLWLKEWLLKGHAHVGANPQQIINISQIGQDYLTADSIHHSLHKKAA